MAEVFEARTAYNLNVDVYSDPITQGWDLSEFSAETGSLYWQEELSLFKLKTSNPSDSQATIIRLTPLCRIAIQEGDAWLLNERATKLHAWLTGYLINDDGVLIWDLNEAIWITPESLGDTKTLASDELSFSKITENFIAIGTGYNAPSGKVEPIKLDLKNRRTISKAYS
jgi:hypothetical protein